MHHIKVIKDGNVNNVVKEQLVDGVQYVDDEPREGSFNGITSGGVARAVAESVEQSNQEMKDMEEMFLVNLPCAVNTLRFEFSKMDYDPTVAGVGSSGTWKKVNAKFHNVWDWTKRGNSFASAFNGAFSDNDNLVSVIAAGDTSAVTSMNGMFVNCSSLTSVPLFDTSAVTNIRNAFFNCSNLKSVPLFDTSAVTDMYAAFYGCSSLTSIPLLNTSAVTNMNSMFSNCSALTSVPLFDTSNVTDMLNMLRNCSALTSIPLFDTSKATNMNTMFYGCTKVESGAQALYQQASTQTTPPSSHTDCFKDCGKDTTTGAAELAQIPADWGGTAP